MKIVRFLTLAVVAAQFGLFAHDLSAQSSSNAAQPTEYPPASFKGLQYVDSKGCVFIRAGVNGNVTWVPRVNRARDVVCGFKPTQVAGTTKVTPAPKLANDVVVITNDTPPAAAPVAVAPKVAKRPVAKPVVRTVAKAPVVRRPVATVAAKAAAPKKVVVRRAPAPVVVRPAAQPVQQRVVKPVVRRVVAPAQRKVVRVPAAVKTAQSTQGCQGVTAISNQYIRRDPRFPVRCGPQSEDPVTFVQVAAAQVPDNARILPKHLYQPPLPKALQPTTPSGYKQVWTDGRLNPHRAEGTLAGKRTMDLIWTRTVPRRLIDQSTGRDMTASNPKLFYPFVNMNTQQTYLANKDRMQVQVSTSGKVRLVERGTRAVVSTKSVPQKQRTQVASAPQKRVVKATAGHRYVQVGTFGVLANAEATAQRLQRMGLPVSYGKISRNGKVLRNVLAGPFTSQGQASVALNKARSAGFRDAYIR